VLFYWGGVATQVPGGRADTPAKVALGIDRESEFGVALRTESSVRELMGVSDEVGDVERNGLFLTKADSDALDAWTADLENLTPTMTSARKNALVTSWFSNLNVLQRHIVAYTTRPDELRNMIGDKWSLEIRPTTNAPQDIDTVFAVASQALFGDLGVPERPPSVALADSLRGSDLFGALRKQGLDVHNVSRTALRDRIEVFVEPSTLPREATIVIDQADIRVWEPFVVLVPRGRSKSKQVSGPPVINGPQVSETRLNSSGTVRGGKANFWSGDGALPYCTNGPVVSDANTGTRYVLTAGHCLDSNLPGWQSGRSTAGVPLQYTVNSRCDFCVWGVDAALLRVPATASVAGPIITQGPGYYNNGQQQGPNYFEQSFGTEPSGANVDRVCFEGASRVKYEGWYLIDARSSCGLTMGQTGRGDWEVILSGYDSNCSGDSGAIVRRSTPFGGSYVLGVMWGGTGYRPPYWPLPPEKRPCEQRQISAPWESAYMYYTEWSRIRNRMNSFLGVNLQLIQ
jgi:hypothetical protein